MRLYSFYSRHPSPYTDHYLLLLRSLKCAIWPVASLQFARCWPNNLLRPFEPENHTRGEPTYPHHSPTVLPGYLANVFVCGNYYIPWHLADASCAARDTETEILAVCLSVTLRRISIFHFPFHIFHIHFPFSIFHLHFLMQLFTESSGELGKSALLRHSFPDFIPFWASVPL